MPYDTEILSPELPIGHKLKDIYTITRTLGQGGFGITYLATEDVTERRVVIKENFPAEFSMRNSTNQQAGPAGAARKENYDWALGAFLNEAKILTQLNHPNIVPVLTAFRELGTAYYVMNYIGGQPLHKAAPQQITEEWLLSILRPMLHALHYIHTLPEVLLHRDIKPDNILVTPEGTPILIDFGAARSVISTHTHSKVGTPGYAPHEQWSSSKKCGPWTDLYALGATCYRLIVGEAPPDCNDRMPDETYLPLAPRPELQGRFSPALLSTIDKALTLRTADRWQSAQDWLEAITPAPTNGTRVPATEESSQPPTPKISKEVAQAELQQKGISAAEYDSKLIEAAENGDDELVKLLIAAGADVNKADKDGETPLSTAACESHTECVKLLLAAGADVNKVDEDGRTPLYKAAWNAHTECVKLLLAAGADVNKANKWGGTPLYSAVTYGRTECVKLLIDTGADVNKADKKGKTPLFWAAWNIRTECVKLLIAAPGIDLSSFTPLSLAVIANNTNKLQNLLAAGADINRADEGGKTPLFWAAHMGHTECVKLLIAAGADVNKADKDGETPLYRAASNGHTECVKLLIAAGADVNKANKDGETPLYRAACWGNTECVKLLIAAGADVNKADKEGQTPLSRAALLGETECVKLLIAAGADVNKASNSGKTPLYWAERFGRTECAELLRNCSGIKGFFKRLFS